MAHLSVVPGDSHRHAHFNGRYAGLKAAKEIYQKVTTTDMDERDI